MARTTWAAAHARSRNGASRSDVRVDEETSAASTYSRKALAAPRARHTTRRELTVSRLVGVFLLLCIKYRGNSTIFSSINTMRQQVNCSRRRLGPRLARAHARWHSPLPMAMPATAHVGCAPVFFRDTSRTFRFVSAASHEPKRRARSHCSLLASMPRPLLLAALRNSPAPLAMQPPVARR